MKLFPASRQGWFGLLLLPFQVYVALAPLGLVVWWHVTRGLHGQRFFYREQEQRCLKGCAFCLLVFLLAALIQCFGVTFARRHGPSDWARGLKGSLIWAGVTLGLLAAFLWPQLSAAK
jgi:hypothetical protein